MRKLIFSLGVLSLLVSCGKDEPVLRISPTVKEVPVNKNEENAGEAGKAVVGEGEKTEKENNPTGESGDEKDATAKDVKEEVKVDLELDELITYFAFDKNKDVSYALKSLKSIHGVKDINNKKIDIKDVVESQVDDAAGVFKLHVKGTINTVNFEKDFDLTGFKKAEVKLDNYQIGKRGYGEWSVTEEVYLSEFKFDELYIGDNFKEITINYLKKFVAFYASNVDGSARRLSEEEVSRLTVRDVKYANNTITFRTAYNNIVSEVMTSLSFDINKYYAKKLKIKKDFAHEKYMRGVYEELSFFFQGLLDYDRNAYVAQLTSDKNKNDGGNRLDFIIKLQTHYDKELATIQVNVDGFKPLSDLKNDLSITTSANLQSSLKSKIKNMTEANIISYLQNTKSWTKLLKFYMKRSGSSKELYWNNDKTVLTGQGSHIEDIYLENPIFEVLSATLADKDLDIKLKLVAVNDVALSDVVFNIKVHNVK